MSASTRPAPDLDVAWEPRPTLPFQWAVGEHMAVDGQTGSGKSTFVRTVLLSRKYEIILRSKPDKVKYVVDKKAKLAKAMLDNRWDRLEIEPKYEEQTAEFARALEYAWKHGKWTVYIDELYYAIRSLKLEPFIERLLTQGRSKGISVVVGMQRPVRVTRFAISEATHIISGNLEGRDARTLGEATWESLELAVQRLERFQFAWGYRPTKQVWVGRVQDLGGSVR